MDSKLVVRIDFFSDFTGADTVSAYQRHGKKTEWESWMVTKDISNTFARFSTPSNIIYDDGKKLESFVIKMYNKTINAPYFGLRKVMVFEKGCQAEQLPPRPISVALKYHTEGALYHAEHVLAMVIIYTHTHC